MQIPRLASLRLAVLAFLGVFLVGHPQRVSAQAPGYAEIDAPSPGQSVEGIVTIAGTADHPAFVRYALSFSYADNPTDTWFRLGEPLPTRVRQGTLGLWDTTDLTPGVYALRLQVYLDNGAVLSDEVSQIRVGLEALPTATSPASARATQAAPSPTPAPDLAPSEPTRAPPRSDPVGVAVVIGGGTAAAFLAFLAVFLPLRKGLASWAGMMRMRRVLRQDERRRRGPRRR